MKMEIILEDGDTSKIYKCRYCNTKFVAIHPRETNTISCPRCNRKIYLGNYTIAMEENKE